MQYNLDDFNELILENKKNILQVINKIKKSFNCLRLV